MIEQQVVVKLPKVVLKQKKISLPIGKKANIKIKKKIKTDKVKKYLVSKRGIIKISKKGIMTGKKKGGLMVTVIMKSGVRKRCKVTVCVL